MAAISIPTNLSTNVCKVVTTKYFDENQVIVDDQLSLTSENPVQNKVITSALNDKVAKVNKEYYYENYTIGEFLSVLTENMGGKVNSWTNT